MTLSDLIGLKIVAVKGWVSGVELKKKKPKIPSEFIFFDDGETFISLTEQDPYTYHDCDRMARGMSLIKNKELYDHQMKYNFDSTICDFIW
jgi:hypothetical protein